MMNKVGVVLGMAAVATLAGCKDPDYKYGPSTQNEPSDIETVPVAIEAKPGCTCLAGTVHASPCACGAADCKCVTQTPAVISTVVTKPTEPVAPVAPVAKPVPAPAAPETTEYIVQRGDYLAKISKKFNVTVSSLKRVNNLKGDNIRIGQKLKLPGKHDVGVQTVPAGAFAKPVAKPAKKAYAPYSGATKEYVVKNGDSLGKIAYGNGISIRQLKELNGIKGDSLKVGQKLKIPAEKVVKPAKDKVPAKPDKGQKPVAKPVDSKADGAVGQGTAAPVTVPEQPTAPTEPAPVVPDAAGTGAADKAPDAAPVASGASETVNYVVKEGEDVTNVAVAWGVSAAVIRDLNNIPEDVNKLEPGQVIKLPADAQQQ